MSNDSAQPSASMTPSSIFRSDGKRVAAGMNVDIAPVDFRNPTSLPEVELRRLRSTYTEFERALTSRFSSHLRSEVAVNLGTLDTQPFERFVEGLKSPSQISIFRVSPLNGIGIVEIPPKLAVELTNRILGGRESATGMDAYLTEIEIALLEDVIGIITSEWCSQWREEAALTAQLVGHETNPKFLNAGDKNALMLVAGMEVAFGRCEEIIQIAVPISMIEPMMNRLQDTHARKTGAASFLSDSSWKPTFDDIVVPAQAEITAARMAVSELLNLKVGDIIELPASALEKTVINIAGSVKFTGCAGQKDGRAAVQIKEKL